MPNLIFLLLIAVMFYVLLIRAPRQRARRRQEMVSAMGVGDEVVTIGGMVGRIAAVDGDRVALEVSPGVRLTFLRAGINRKVEPEPDGLAGAGDTVDLTGGGAEMGRGAEMGGEAGPGGGDGDDPDGRDGAA